MGFVEPNLSRRQFVVASLSTAGGLMLGVSFPRAADAMPLSQAPWSNDAVVANEISAWILIDPDETITIRIPPSSKPSGTSSISGGCICASSPSSGWRRSNTPGRSAWRQ